MSKLNQFDRIAGVYDWIAALAFWGAIKRSQLQFLHNVPNQAFVLIIGGGSGWIINELKKVSPHARIYYVEASENMISRARKKCLHNNVEFIHGTENDIPSGVTFDVVITNFFLDLFQTTDLTKVVARISRSLKPDGRWLVTEFTCNSKWQQLYLSLMYFFFKLTCGLRTVELPKWKDVLDKAGFLQTKEKNYFNRFIESVVFVRTSG